MHPGILYVAADRNVRLRSSIDWLMLILSSMWKRLGQPLSGKQIAVTIVAVLIMAGLGDELYHGASSLWHRRLLEKAIPAALVGVRGQREALIGAIESYKARFGYYPPLYTGPGQARGVLNPLCYELLGARFDAKDSQFYVPITKDGLAVDEVQKLFNMHSFSNCLAFPIAPTNFLANRLLTCAPLTKDTDAFGVAVSFTEVTTEPFWEDFEFSPWRYTTNPAEHNPGKFDLWVEVDVAGKHFTIGNWPEVK
jgi:hypothetical protein